MLRRLRTLRGQRNESGAAAVEFALVGLILLVLLIGTIQFAIWFWGYQAGSHAAREGARFAAVEPCTDGPIETRTTTRANELAPTDGTPTASVSRVPSSDFAVGDEITVEVSFSIVDFGLVPGFPATVTKSATSRIENIPAGGC